MPFRPAPTRGSAPIDKSKKPAFRDASQVTHVRDINTVGSYVSTNGVLTSVKKAMQAATGGNFVLSSTDFRAETDSRIRQTRIQQPLPLDGEYEDAFIVQYTSGGFVNTTLNIKGSNAENAFSVTYDSSGNIIVVGNFYTVLRLSDRLGRVLFSLTNLRQDNTAGFVVKYDSNGTPSWASLFYSYEGFEAYDDVVTDSSGNIYALGSAGSLSTITNGDGTAYTNTVNYPSSSSGCYLVKYSPSGMVQWVVKADGNGNGDTGGGVCIDSSNNLTFCGRSLTDMTAFNADGTAFSPTTGGAPAGVGLFLVQYTSAGTVNWHAEMHTSEGGWPWASAITSDTNGNLNVCGYYPYGTLTFRNKNNGTAFARVLTGTSGGIPHGFVGQYSSTGDVNWAAKIRCSGGQTPAIGLFINDCDTDSLGNVIVCGGFSGGYLYVDNADGTTFPSGGVSIASGSSSGTATTYTTSSAHGLRVGLTVNITGTTNGNHNVSTVRIATIPTPTTFTITNTVANGQTSTGGTVFFQPAPYWASSFVVKYSSTGVVQWVTVQLASDTSLSGTYFWASNDNVGNAISIDRSTNNINVTGYFAIHSLICYNEDGTFHTTAITNNSNDRNIFVVQYSPQGNVNWVSRMARVGAGDISYGSDTNSKGETTIVGAAGRGLIIYDKTGLPASTNIYPAM